MNELEKKINKLRHDIHDHNHNYYILDNPTISDYDFDQKLQELINLESLHPEFYDSNSPTNKVGGEVVNSFASFQHNYPMLSLSNTYSEEELIDFDKKYINLSQYQLFL